MAIVQLNQQMLFVPFTLGADQKTLIFTKLFPVLKHIKEVRKEMQNNPLARKMPLQYQEMTRAELLALEAQEKLCLPPVIS